MLMIRYQDRKESRQNPRALMGEKDPEVGSAKKSYFSGPLDSFEGCAPEKNTQ